MTTVTEEPVTKAVASTVKPAATPHSSTSATRYTVSVTLDPHVHEHFAKKAEADDRTLAKFLARHLRDHVNALKKDDNF